MKKKEFAITPLERRRNMLKTLHGYYLKEIEELKKRIDLLDHWIKFEKDFKKVNQIEKGLKNVK
jgi:hypothetical protein